MSQNFINTPLDEGEQSSSKVEEPIGKQLVAEVIEYRDTLNMLIDRVNSLTEIEVMGAVEALGTIVENVSGFCSQINTTLGRVSTFEIENDESLVYSIEEQSQSTEQFLDKLKTNMVQQREIAAQAYDQSLAISEAASSVEMLSQQATILAINATIEAARMGAAGSGFRVIGNEMKWLSEEIKATNTMVSGLSDKLGNILPSIAQMIQDTSDSADEFTTCMHDTISRVRERSFALQGGVEELLTSNHDILSVILDQSNEALSHLQFQDTVAQGLRRIDTTTRELVINIGAIGGEDMSEIEVEESRHVELGGEKEVSPDSSGDLMIF